MATPPQRSTRRWRYENTPVVKEGAARRARRRRLGFGIATLFTLAVVAAVVFYWLSAPTKTAFVAIGFAQYQDLPLNPYASQDREALGPLFDIRAGAEAIRQEKDSVQVQLDELGGLGARGARAVVAYVYGYALVDQEVNPGHVMVLPSDLPPDAPASKGIDLEVILKAFAACPADRLLLLDLRPPPADPWLGRLPIDLGAAIKKQVAETPINGFVITACDEGQRSVVSQVLQQSVFGHFLARGLKGEADGDYDESVSVSELATYLEREVPAWVLRVYQGNQNPVQLAKGARDFKLRHLNKGSVTNADEPVAQVVKYPPGLAWAWNRLADLRDDRGYRLHPLAWRQLEAKLLQTERAWRGGADVAAAETEVNAALAKLETAAKPVTADAAPPSLALAKQLAWKGWKPNEELAKTLEKELRKVELPAATPGKDEPAATLFSKPLRALDEPLKTFKTAEHFKLDLAWAVMSRAVPEIERGADRFAFLNAVLADQTEEQPRFVETILLARLARLVKGSPDGWQPGLFERALNLATRGEDVAARWHVLNLDSEDPGLKAAAQARHDFETLLLARGFAGLADARGALAKAQDGYEGLEKFADAWSKAQSVREQALAALPGFAAYLEAHPQVDLQSIADGLAALRNLEQVLRESKSSQSLDVQKDADLVDGMLRSVRGVSVQSLIKLAADKNDAAAPLVLRQIDAVLHAPLVVKDPPARSDAATGLNREGKREPPALNDRGTLWNARVELERHLADPANVPARSGVVATAWPVPNPDVQKRFAEQYLSCIEELTLPAAVAKNVSLRKRSDQLRLECERLLEKGTPAGAEVARADLLLKVLHAWDARDKPIGQSTSPRLAEEERTRRAFQRWLAGRLFYESIEAPSSDPARDAYKRLSGLDPQAASDVPVVTIEPPTEGLRSDQATRLTVSLGKVTKTTTVTALPVAAQTDAHGLAFPAARQEQQQLSQNGSGALTVRLEPPSGGASAATKGVVVRLNVDGWTIHRRLPISDAPAKALARDELKLLLGASADPESAGAVLPDDLGLRATTGQSFFVFLGNTGKEAKKAKVEVRDGATVLARSGDAPLTIPAGKKAMLVPLTVVASTPPPAAPGQPVVEGAAVRGQLTIHVMEEGKEAQTVSVGAAPRSPREYLEVTPLSSAADKPSLRVQVRLKKEVLPNATVRIEFVLPDSHFATGQVRRVVLSPDHDTEELVIDDVKLADHLKGPAFAYLTVDGWPRAFTFRVEPIGRRLTMGSTSLAVLLQAPTAIKDDKYLVTVLPDFTARDVELEVKLSDLKGAPLHQPEQPFDVDKLRRLRLRGADAGGLTFDLHWEPWTEKWDAPKGQSRGQLSARLFTKTGHRAVGDPMTLDLLFDATKPTVMEFNPPTEAFVGQELPLTARGEDEQSGITAAFFGIARAGPEKEPDFKWFDAALIDGRYVKRIPPPDKADDYLLVVRFVNGVGHSETSKAEKLKVKPASLGPAEVRGRVVMTDFPQPDVPVRLVPKKKTTPPQEPPAERKVETNADGVFVFSDVDPGEYELVIEKSNFRTIKLSITVKAGEKKDVKKQVLIIR